MRFYGNVKGVLSVEAGDPMPTVEDFQDDPWSWAEMDTDISKLSSMNLGTYPVEIRWLCFSKTATLFIRDSVAPEGKAQDLVKPIGTEIKPEDFVVSSGDLTGVKIYFFPSPDLTVEGTQTVRVALEDAAGNQTILNPRLTLFDPEKTPEIIGALDQSVYVGETISYRSGVRVRADMDDNPKLEIDNSSVRLDTPGVYPVTYTATDAYGRWSRLTVRISVMELPANYYDMLEMNEKADRLLSELLTADMTEIQRAFQIFRWVRKNIPWNNTRTTRDEVEQGLAGLNGNAGDCYTHAITCKLLLDRAGFQTMLVERYPGPGQHYWILIRIDRQWYHMDPSPIYMQHGVNFLATDADLERFTLAVRPNYYAFDYSKYPATPLVSPAKVTYRRGEYTLETE